MILNNTVIRPSNISDSHNTEEIVDIITKTPSWLLRWGISLFLGIILMILVLSSFISYPDIVKANLTIYSLNSPKSIVAKISGKLVKLLVLNNETITKGQILAYIESTADHSEVIKLLSDLKKNQNTGLQGGPTDRSFFNPVKKIDLGELQVSYQTFFQAYLTYKSSIENGFYVRQRMYLQNDITFIVKQENQLKAQKELQLRDLTIAENEFAMHQKLAEEKVESPATLGVEESKFLSKKSALIQTEAALIATDINHSNKQKEILALDNQIFDEKSKFAQALNSLISQIEEWESKYVLVAPQSGKLSYAGIVQEGQVLSANQEVFNVSPENEGFFGEMIIPQNNMGKIKEGQDVLIKLKSYPYEEYGILHGRIGYIAEVPYRDSVFISKVDFKLKSSFGSKMTIHLKQGMTADAEIVTQEATLLNRITRNLIRLFR